LGREREEREREKSVLKERLLVDPAASLNVATVRERERRIDERQHTTDMRERCGLAGTL